MQNWEHWIGADSDLASEENDSETQTELGTIQNHSSPPPLKCAGPDNDWPWTNDAVVPFQKPACGLPCGDLLAFVDFLQEPLPLG